MNVAEFLAYWQSEGAAYARRGDYAWMAGVTPGQRILEIGCGPGFGTQALLERGCSVLVLDSLEECLAAAAARCVGMSGLRTVQGDVTGLAAAVAQQITDFAPDAVVCWLMGAPAETTGAQVSDGGKAVAAYREQVHRAVAELASKLPSVMTVHLVDRTAIPWQAKDVGRDTLVAYHQGKTLLGLPWRASRADALYRKLEGNVVSLGVPRAAHLALKSVVPVLASLLIRRGK